ncbi:FadR/GntR family transcriptional regulator [Streptomyces chattanoogensis]|uniref:FadR-family transcriptional regulator n=1 Tax=Streptomyces chattanoogensis TaxID=66876 RepID=A0A0N0GUW8_9ACTN|nr:FadR/GntR family transcriptional regulator [Streptomyces chattanoogensis]KPC58759.1 FadR-family transcriptional regulator [Streptomyces chattanoogensis]
MTQLGNAASSAGRGGHKETVEVLAGRILDGTYGEGKALALPDLTAELDVSQTVVREALKLLAAKGLVDAHQKGDSVVRPREDWNLLDSDVLRWKLAAGASSDFFADMLELRRSIEPAAAALAAERRTDDDLAVLDAAVSTMAVPDADPALLIRADASFHTAMLLASNNRFYAQLQRVIVPVLIQRDRAVHAGGGEFEHPHPAHAAVVEAVRARDVDGAYMAMLELLDKSAHGHP